MKRRLNILTFVFITHCVSGLYAQFYNGLQMAFGKNRVQYEREAVIWSYYRFENFDTYFYQNGKELAINAAKYAHKITPELESRIDYYLEKKLQFVIFNSMSDMKQSNIGLSDEYSYNIGGFTRIIGTTIILYFDGNYREFEKQIRRGIATVLVNQLIYGDDLGANIKNSALLYLPKWYVEGLISYVSEDWNTDLDNIARDGFLSGKYKKFNNLTGDDAVIGGHSIWKYLNDRYGKEAVQNVVYLTRIARNIESGFLYFTGISFKNLIKEWYLFNYERYYDDTTGRTMPVKESNLPVKLKKESVLLNLAISPDEKRYAYSVDRQNRKTIYVADIETGKSRKIFKFGQRIDDEQDFSYPLLAWHPREDILAFLIERKGIKHLYYYRAGTKKPERLSVFGVDKIHSINYSPDGFTMVVSATLNGQSDIFLYHLASKTFERITKDVFDDLHPSYVDNGRYIAFSSNRISDTIVYDKDTYLRDYAYTPEREDNFNIFMYNVKTKENVLRRITNLEKGDAFKPFCGGDGNILYLSTQNGITNRYVAKIDSVISHVDTVIHYRYFPTVSALTDYPANIINHNLSEGGNIISEIIFQNNSFHAYKHEVDVHFTDKPLPSKTNYMQELDIIHSPQIETLAPEKQRQSYPIKYPDTTDVNINEYEFSRIGKPEGDTLKTEPATEEATDTLPTFMLPHQRNYDVEYSVNQLVSQLDYSFLNTSYQTYTGAGPIFLGPEMNSFFRIGLTDLLEDYRLIGAFRISLNLNNYEFFLGFEDYKNRVDRKWIFHRQSYTRTTETSRINHRQNTLHYILQYPFNNVLSLRSNFLVRQDKMHYLSISDYNLKKPDADEFWGGIKTELVFDNTRNPQLNIYYGQRWKVWGEYLQLISSEQKNLVVFGFDFRNYTQIHKNFIFANRFAGSSSFGNNRLIYYLGGVDNWILPRFDYDVNISRDRNYGFQALATNMRGFEQNIRNGSNFMVINSELRLPVLSYFMNRPLRSEFFHNLQIAGFGDIGTAWEGLNPFSEDNSLFTHTVHTNTVTIIVKRQKNPVVGGFGAGLRSKLFGYFIKGDLAWGIEDGNIRKPIFYVSLSLDF